MNKKKWLRQKWMFNDMRKKTKRTLVSAPDNKEVANFHFLKTVFVLSFSDMHGWEKSFKSIIGIS